jgi:MoxR-like ATPase
MLQGRDFVTPDDLKALSPRCLRHRIIVRAEVEIEGYGADSVLTDVLGKVAVPR